MDTVELFLHPVRLRVVHALSGGRTLTTGELCARFPDVSKATMYRHVARLLDGGMLEVVDERRVHSVLERRYRLREAKASIDPDRATSMSADEHRRLFGVAMATLLAEFDAYLDREGSDPAADPVSYLQTTLWLDAGELDELFVEIRDAIRAKAKNKASTRRSPYLVSPVLFPAAPLG
ncbi:MAG: helix-turn-helix domain-containing protein [Kutzneria sp.]|nr:helix-turn-helix domain-containing protein [Kutzneria sp.]